MKRKKIGAIALTLFALFARADVTYYVAKGGDGTDPTSGDLAKAYAHPQDAIDAADGTTPTVIRIATGTYGLLDSTIAQTEVLKVAKDNLTLEALDGYGTVTLDGGASTGSGNYTHRVLTVAAGLSNVTFRNLIFKRGNGCRDTYGATCVSASSGTFEHCDMIGYCVARSTVVSLAGTCYLTNCYLTTTSSMSVDSNSTFTYFAISGSAVLEDTVIGDTYWYANGGHYTRPFEMSGSATLRRCTIRNITTGRANGTLGSGYGTFVGGGLYATGGTIEDCVFTNNLVYGYGGGLGVEGAVTVKGCKFRDNRATGRYNDICLKSGKYTVSDCAGEDFDGTNGNLGAWPDKEQDGASYAIVVSNAVRAVRAGVEVPVRLDATSDATPTDYAWTFEDESVASGRSVAHTFAAAGKHTVTCVVTLSDSSTVTVTKKVLVVGPVCYVSKDGSNEAPYDTLAKAALHPQDALDLMPAKVEIDTGKYGLRNGKRDTSILSFAYGYDNVEVTAKNGRGTVWLNAGTSGPDNGALSRVVTVGKGLANVTVSDLCLTNGWSCYNADNGPGTIYAYAGTFRNCSINLSGFSRNGGGMITKTAVLTNCLVTSISPYTSTGSAADIGISVSAGAKLIDCEICNYKWCTGWTYNIPCVSMSGADSLIRGCLFHDISIGKSGSGLTGAAVYATGGTIENCTITDCKSWNKGGGIYINGAGVVCRNNIVYGNTAVNGGNDIGTSTDYSMVTHTLASDLTTSKDTGNLQSASILFKSGTYELDKDSQCVNAGENQNWMDGATDRAGNPRIYDETVDMGAYECQEKSTSLIADFSVSSAASFGPPPLDIEVTANVAGGGDGAQYSWDWGDGSFLEMSATNGVVTHTYTNVGAYTIWMTVKRDGLTTDYALTNIVAAVGEICYVSTNGAAIPPYDTWAKATSNIQDAVAYKPKTVLVSNGVYRVSYDDDDYGIKLYSPIRLVSVNGASNTVIQSNYANPTTGDSRARNLVRMTDAGAAVEGFTLRRTCAPMVYATKGRFENNIVTESYKMYDSCSVATFAGPVGVTNCVFDGSSMSISWVNWTGALVGLSAGATMERSIVRNATYTIGSANNCERSAVSLIGATTAMRNSLVTGTYANMKTSAKQNWGVRVTGSATVENCTVVKGNVTSYGAGISADSTAKIRNVISYDNHYTADSVQTDLDLVGSPATFQNNLVGAGTLPAAAENCILGVDPLFVDDGAGYRITKDSPCYNAGRNLKWCRRKGMATDLDGQERHRNRPDIGCYEVPRDLGLSVIIGGAQTGGSGNGDS